MIKRLILLLVMVWTLQILSAQQIDQRIGQLLNTSDWFGLQEELQSNGDAIQTPFLKLLAETMMAYHANQPDKALACLNKLLENHQTDLGISNVVNLLTLKYIILKSIGAYQQMDRELSIAIEQLKKQNGAEGLEMLENLFNINKHCIGYQPLSISKPAYDVTVPLTIDTIQAKQTLEWFHQSTADRGHIMTIPVTVHGQKHAFIFDTGASGTYLSMRKAKQLGVKIFNDTTVVNGKMLIHEGYLDSLQIGNITIRNLLVYVGMPSETDSVFTFDAILGLDCLKAIGESQINYAARKIVFPAHPTPVPLTGSNLLIDNIPMFKAYRGQERLIFKLDTGDDSAELSPRYYQTHRHEVDQYGVAQTITKGSYNDISNKRVALIPYITFEVGYRKMTITPIYVSTDVTDAMKQNDGVMGMKLIRQTRKVTINLKDMFLKLE